MAVTISNAYIQTFERTVRQLAQQGVSRVRPYVTERSENSQKHNWDRLGKGAAVQKVATLVATPAQQLAWSRRVSIAQTWHAGEAVEQEDIVQMLIDPNSAVAENLAMSMRRAMDDIIITAATGNATDGAGGAVAFPAGQLIGDGTTPISFDMVTAVQELFMQNDITPDVEKTFVVGPTQVRKLMQLTEQTSGDYVQRQALQSLSSTGIVPNWMGFTWVMSTRLLVPAGGQLSCLAFTKRALGFHVPRDITVRVQEDPSVSFAWRLYAYATAGATRVEDEQIVHVKVKNALT